MYLIEHRIGEADGDLFPLVIDLEPIDRLKLHEETIPDSIQKLCRDLETSKTLDHPVVIEKTTGVVLDGTHRTMALKELGLQRVPVQSIDVDEVQAMHRRELVPEPILQSWYWGIPTSGRSISVNDFARVGFEVDGRLDLTTTIGSIPDNVSEMDILADALAPLGIVLGFIGAGSGECVVLRDSLENTSVGDQLRRLSCWLIDQRFTIDYRTRRFSLSDMEPEGIQALIIPPHLTMAEVRNAAEGPPLPPKSTCFVLPARALHICVPFHILMNGDRRAFDSFLTEKPIYRTEGPLMLDRPYGEPWLYLFDKPRPDIPGALLEGCPSGRIA
jgi:hypothetical protein